MEKKERFAKDIPEIDNLIDSDSGREDENRSFEKDEMNVFSHRMRENQQIGFKLAEEIQRLREELSKERQEKRLLLITNENLQEQLNIAEQRMKQFEIKEMAAAKKASSFDSQLGKEFQKNRYAEEDILRRKSEVKNLKYALAASLKSAKSFETKYHDAQHQLAYWKECVTVYEAKIRDMLQEKEIHTASISDQRQQITDLETFLFKMRSKFVRFYEGCLDLILPEAKLRSENLLSVNINNSKLDEEEFQFDALLRLIKKRNAEFQKERKKFKSYIQKLIRVIKMYEEMTPSVEAD